MTLTGQAEFRSTVAILRDGKPVATAEPERDGAFSVDVELDEGPNELTAVASNYAGDSPASAAVTVVLDTTGPTVTWTPADHDGFFARGHGERHRPDAHAGVAEVLVNGRWPLTPRTELQRGRGARRGPEQADVTARDEVGNETTESRAVGSSRIRRSGRRRATKAAAT